MHEIGEIINRAEPWGSKIGKTDTQLTWVLKEKRI